MSIDGRWYMVGFDEGFDAEHNAVLNFHGGLAQVEGKFGRSSTYTADDYFAVVEFRPGLAQGIDGDQWAWRRLRMTVQSDQHMSGYDETVFTAVDGERPWSLEGSHDVHSEIVDLIRVGSEAPTLDVFLQAAE